ncbi:MAG: HEAT repeat domain-containing protein [Acidobacteriota bacterium]
MSSTLVPAETIRDVRAFARMLVAAARARQLYTADHPAAMAAAERLRTAFAQLAGHGGLELGITPAALMANGEVLAPDERTGEAAALLHERDLLRLRVRSAPALNEASDFLQLLGFDGNTLRKRGGPARVWEHFGHRWLEVDQLDYDSILAATPAGRASGGAGSGGGDGGRSASQDDVWTALVRSIAGGRPSADAPAQKRLVDIARSAESIQMLASQAASVHTAPSGSALAAAQAATILATFEHLVSTVRTNAPDDLSVAVKNVAKAAGRLDPALMMRAIAESAESGLGSDLTATLGRHFDDGQIATMLARSLAAEGRASGRMAAALSTLTPESDRRDRVVRLAQSMSTPADNASGLETAWASLQRFMSGPADVTYVSDGYSASLDQAEARSRRLMLDVPVELDDWMQTVSSDSVRTLSVTLLLDLFSLEDHPAALTETAGDLAVLVGDLLLSGDLSEALRVATALQAAGGGARSGRALAARLALESIASSPALAEMLAAAGDLDTDQFGDLVRLCLAVGPGVIRGLVSTYAASVQDDVRERLCGILSAFREDGISALGRLAHEPDWQVARGAIQLLGRLGARDAVVLLLPIARDQDLRRAREAIAALIKLDDPAAPKAISRILTMGGPGVRDMAIDALAASRDRRASPVVAGLLPHLDVLGADFDLALRTLAALRIIGDESAIESLVGVARARRWFARAKTRELRHGVLGVLNHIDTPAARDAITMLARRGDRALRRLAREALRGEA